MKSSSFAKAITLGCLALVAVPVACGDDTSNPGPAPSSNAGAGGETTEEGGTGGRGGAGVVVAGAGGAATIMLPEGISNVSKTIECSGSCDSAKVGLGAQVYYLDPCCGGTAKDECGLNTAFLATAGVMFEQSCQPKAQEGPLDNTCPQPPAAVIPMGTTMVPLDAFKACCRADTGTCGVFVDAITLGGGLVSLGKLGLGCLDSAPFFNGVPGKACGGGGGGSSGGASAVAGAGGASSVAGAASLGGAGGAP